MAEVSAADVNQTIGDTNNLVSSVDTLGVSLSNDDFVGSADNGTFTDLQKKIDGAEEGSTITLENNYYVANADTVFISKTLTIDGNGFTIDGNKVSRIFNIEADNVVLKNITFINGCGWNVFSKEYAGGALHITGDNTVISNCHFENNWVDYTDYGNQKGGAIYTEGNLQCINSTFKENGIRNFEGLNHYGGAIYSNSELTIKNSNFISNYFNIWDIDEGYGYGGAVYGSIVNVHNSTFENNNLNVSCASGGAIYAGVVNVYDSTFINNCAKSTNSVHIPTSVNGGAISADTVNIYDSKFINNRAIYDLVHASSFTSYSANGGAIDANSVNVYGSEFINNSVICSSERDNVYCSANGGAIRSNGDLNVSDSSFISNKANDGEALWAYAAYTNMNNATFVDNDYALKKIPVSFNLNLNPSAIVSVGQNIEISVEFSRDVTGNVTIRVNDNEKIVKIVNNRAILVLSDLTEGTYDVNVTFYENEYYEYVSDTNKFRVLKGSFITFRDLQELIDNAPDNGTIYLTDYCIYDKTIDPGQIHIGKDIAIIGNGNIIDANFGPKIFYIGAPNVVLDNITFINANDRAISGEVINVKNSAFINNSAPYYCAAAISGSVVNLMNCSFINNSANSRPGAVYAYKLNMTNCIFVNNTPNGYKKDVTMDIELESFTYHVGDVITINVNVHETSEGNVTFNIADIQKTVDLVDGKANLTINGLAKEKYIVNVKFNGNDYYDVCNQTADIAVIDDSYGTFDDLQALIDNAVDGDTIYLTKDYISNGSSIYINKNITIKGNGHLIDANNVFRSSFLLLAENIVFDNLTFTDFASPAIDSRQYRGNYEFLNITISNCCFENNNGCYYLLALGYTVSTVINSDFINNNIDGQVIFGNIIYIDNSNFINNNAGDMPNVCTVLGKNVVVTNSVFSNNKILTDWNYFYVYDIYCDNLLVENSTFINNSTDMDDYIYVRSQNKTVINCEFIYKSGPVKTYTYKDLQSLIDGARVGQIIDLDEDYTYNESVDNNIITINKTITIKGKNHIIDAIGKAGIFKISGNNVVLDSLVLSNANAEKGAAVFITGSNVLVQNTIFEDGTAQSGAGIYSEGLKTTISNSTFINNVADIGAGALLYGDAAKIFKSNFISNEAGLGAGVVSYGLRTNCSDSFFENNTASIENKLSSDNYDLSVDDILRAEITSGIGAGLVLYGDDSIVQNSEFVGNNANECAGLYIGADNCVVINSLFDDNAAQSGAGMIIEGENAKVISSTFTNNNAQEGAGILVNALNATISHSSFKDNTAQIGTAILVEENASIVIESDDVSDKPLTVAYISSLEIIVNPVEVNEDVTIKVVVKSASIYPISGTVTIKFANEEYKVKVENNSAIKVISGLPAGVYDVSAKYSGDVNHTSSSAAGNFTVSKISNVNITSEIDGAYSGERSNITFNLPKDATGTVTATVNGKKYNAPVTDGSATITLDELPVGDYKLDAQYSGDDKYASVNYTTDIAIESSIVINAPDLVKYYKGPERFVVTVTDYKGNVISGENVTINLNGKDYIRTTDDKGVASMAINLNSGKYNVTVKYGDCSVNSTITVKSTVSGQNITKMYRNGTQYYATFIDTNGNALANNTAVEFNINGVFYTRYTNEKGVARMNINLNPGEYIITAKNPNSGEMYTNIITVLSTIVENNDLTKYYKNASQYSLRLLDAQGNPVGAGVEVKLNINGVFYTRSSNASGYVNMNINLVTGTYTITAEYNGLRASNTIKVLPVIETKDLSMKYKDGSKFEAKILDGQGKPYAGQEVTFNINGVFYKRTTGEDGVARLSINLLAGKYIITTMYNGLNAANKVTISS